MSTTPPINNLIPAVIHVAGTNFTGYVCNIYTRAFVKQHPDKLFIFGDNVERKGGGGQAVIRGLPNVFGIATKWAPTYCSDDYFSDLNRECLPIIATDLSCLKARLAEQPQPLVYPVAGIGTGRAMLQTMAPNLLKYLTEQLYATRVHTRPCS